MNFQRQVLAILMKAFLFLFLSILMASCNFVSQVERSSQLIRPNRPSQDLGMEAIGYDTEIVNDTFETGDFTKNTIEGNTRAILQNIETISRSSEAISYNIAAVQRSIDLIDSNEIAIHKNTEVVLKNTEAVENLNKLITQSSFPTFGWFVLIATVFFIVPWIILCIYSLFNHGQLVEIKKILKKEKKE